MILNTFFMNILGIYIKISLITIEQLKKLNNNFPIIKMTNCSNENFIFKSINIRLMF